MNKQVSVCVLLLQIIINVSSERSKLLSIVQVFRHGARTPVFFYPTDPYIDPKYWNGLSPGQLTEVGQKQLYNLGKYFKDRYTSFIGNQYEESDISIKSTSSDRNIKSAKAFMKGLYENLDATITIAKLPIISTLIVCLKFDTEYLKSEAENQDFIEVNQNNRELYDYLNKHTEVPIFGLLTAFLIWDTLHIENGVNLELPEWTETVWPKALTQVVRNFTKLFCHTEEQQRIGTGAFLTELFEHFDNIINKKEEPRISLYSAHDINLICFLSAFEFFETELNPIQFASSIIFELRQDEETGDFFINTFYKPSVEEEEIPLSVRKCDIDCKLEDFKDRVSHLLLTEEEWYKTCYYLP